MEGYGYKKPDIVPKFWRDKYEKEASKYWDAFYKKNTTRFFKDRHWIQREFVDLQRRKNEVDGQDTGMIYAAEVGCGVGNTVFPILQEMPKLFVYAVDFAPTAVDLLKQNPLYEELKRCKAAVCDITKDDPCSALEIEHGQLDFVLLVFCLSAISPEHFPDAIGRLHKMLKPGGMILLRDYGLGDAAQERFAKDNADKKLGENFYVRHDGTRAYYFSLEYMAQLMESQGFEIVENDFVKKQIENKKLGITMDRVWIQCRARKRN